MCIRIHKISRSLFNFTCSQTKSYNTTFNKSKPTLLKMTHWHWACDKKWTEMVFARFNTWHPPPPQPFPLQYPPPPQPFPLQWSIQRLNTRRLGVNWVIAVISHICMHAWSFKSILYGSLYSLYTKMAEYEEYKKLVLYPL